MIKPGIYRHFKGNYYEVVGAAKHSETLEDMVIYKALYGEGGTWVRPAAMWHEPVEVDGKNVRRFELVFEDSVSWLDATDTGVLSTINPDGSPYAVPVHFIFLDGKVYIHCGAHGQKYENILRSDCVSFTAWEMSSYSHNDNPEPCRTGTNYRSVVLNGNAAIVEDSALKRKVLQAVAVKYTPHKDADNIPEEAVNRTCVIEICGEMTEKAKGV
jgi:nitroimidazol reductase NimA-like FMN-containing flavoprotein (pyridoxamine 5'-phosphate oxidase superfamily)